MYTYEDHGSYQVILTQQRRVLAETQIEGDAQTITDALNLKARSANKDLLEQHAKDTNEIAQLWLLILRIGNVIKDYQATNKSAPKTALEMIQNYLKNADAFTETEEK